MKTLTLSLVATFLAVTSHGIERHYVNGAVLTKAQEKTVIELATKAGIKKVAKISSHNMYPSPFRGLRVEGVEKVKGREVSCPVLSVSHGPWLQPGAKPRKGEIKMGDFWAGKPFTRKQIILKAGKKEYRAGSIQGMTPEACERILARLLSGRYDTGAGVDKEALKQADWTKPSHFAKRGGIVSAGFLHKAEGGGFFELEIKEDGNALTITQLLQAVP